MDLDVSKLKKVLEDHALRNYRTIWNAVQFGVILVDASTRKIIDMNNAAVELCGAPRENYQGKPCHCTVCPAAEDDCPVLDRGETVDESERWLVRADGTRLPILQTVVRAELNGRDVLIESFIDLTEQKETEQKLQATRRMAATVLDSTSDMIFLVGMDGMVNYLNAAALRHFAMAEYVPGTIPLCFFWCGDSIDRIESALQAVLEKLCSATTDCRCGENYYEVALTPVIEDEKMVAVVCTARDITARRRAMTALAENEAKLNSVLMSINDNIVMLDKEKTVTWANEHALATYGENIVGQKCADIYHAGAETGCQEACDINKVFATGESCRSEHCRADSKGKRMTLEVTTSVAMWDKDIVPTAVIEVSRDITEQRRLQAAVLQAEKMSTIGTMISGVAHELNNPLAGVLGYAELLLEEDLEEQTRSDILEIQESAQRCKRIIDNLLIFSRKYEPARELCQVNQAVLSAYNIKKYEMELDDVETILALTGDLPETVADIHQLEQVFLNIINNAHRALNKHGLPRILRLSTVLKGGVISVAIGNNGGAIPPHIMEHLFDPFFTTEGVGKGTGLGLAICYGIITDHGGTIRVESTAAEGTVFHVELPVQRDDVSGGEPGAVTVAETETLPKRILVIDDEKNVRDILERHLRKNGHAVRLASTSVEAYDILADSTFDIVLCDIRLPGQHSGFDLYDFARLKNGDAMPKFAFVTGQTADAEVIAAAEEREAPMIAKPFSLQQITAMVDD